MPKNEDAIRKAVNEFRRAGNKITVESIVAHTGGSKATVQPILQQIRFEELNEKWNGLAETLRKIAMKTIVETLDVLDSSISIRIESEIQKAGLTQDVTLPRKSGVSSEEFVTLQAYEALQKHCHTVESSQAKSQEDIRMVCEGFNELLGFVSSLQNRAIQCIEGEKSE